MAEFLSGIPSQNRNQLDAVGKVSAESLAREVVEFHRKGLQSARRNLLTAEKYAIHLDGEGDAQWADIYAGNRVVIPSAFSGQSRPTENLLRPIVDNAVAYHTTRPFRFAVEATADRDSRARATLDQAIINHMSRKGRWNRVMAEALYFGEVAGACPVHAFWRDDLTVDMYEPVYTGNPGEEVQQQQGIRKGMLDAYVGDPWDTVYNPGARRNSLHVYQYGRTLPLSVVVAAFSHVKGIERLQGSEREPSASRMQRISRRWLQQGLNVHGQAALTGGQAIEPMIALICREKAPGLDPEYPMGRITIVALQDAATTDDAAGMRSGFLLHDGPLPASRFSHVRIYSHHRQDDIRGKPFVSDLDDLQVKLNQLLMFRDEFIRRNVRPPLWYSGLISEDTAVWEDNAQMEGEPGSQTAPQFLQLRIDAGTLNNAIQETRQAMWTIGGYQAASRGEGNAGDSGAKVVALAKADDSIHGPINQRFREDVEDYAKLAHALFREYADIPWLIEATGSEYTHMIEPWIDRGMVSQEDPSVELVSGFGATLETLGNQLMQMVGQTGADGEPLMTTRQFKAAWPDRSVYPGEEDVRETRERKAQSINARIRSLANDVEKQMGPEMAVAPQNIVMAFQALQQEYPPAPDDDPIAHFDALSSITQDVNESKLAREIAKYRQAGYQNWAIMLGMMPPPPIPLPMIEELMGMPPQPSPLEQQQMMQQQQAQQQDAPQPKGGRPRQTSGAGGSESAEAIRPKPGEMAQLTAEAQGANI